MPPQLPPAAPCPPLCAQQQQQQQHWSDLVLGELHDAITVSQPLVGKGISGLLLGLLYYGLGLL